MAKKVWRKCNNDQCDIFNISIEVPVTTERCRNCGNLMVKGVSRRPSKNKFVLFFLVLVLIVLFFLVLIMAGGWFYLDEIKPLSVPAVYSGNGFSTNGSESTEEKIKKLEELEKKIKQELKIEQSRCEAEVQKVIDKLETVRIEKNTTTWKEQCRQECSEQCRVEILNSQNNNSQQQCLESCLEKQCSQKKLEEFLKEQSLHKEINTNIWK